MQEKSGSGRRGGVLYHVANRTLSFSRVRHRNLPLAAANLPGLDLRDVVISSISVTSGRSCACAQCLPTPARQQLIHLDGPQLLFTGVRGVRKLTSIVRRLTFQLQALHPVAAPTPAAPSHASLPAARPSPRSLRTPVTGAPIVAPPPDSDSSDSSLAQLTTFLDGLTCPAPRLHLTSSATLFRKLCSTGDCDTHCRSRRCLHHCSDRRFAQLGDTHVSSQLHPNTTPPRFRVCRAVGCHSSTHSRCRVGFFCSNHCRGSRCRGTRQPASTQPTCRRPHCSELVQVALLVVAISIVQAHAVPFSRSLIPVGKRPGGRLAAERRLRNPQPLSFNHLAARSSIAVVCGGPTTPSTTASWAW